MVWVHPFAFAISALDSLLTVPIILHPIDLAHWQANKPTPPAAAWNNIFSFLLTLCNLSKRYSTVIPLSKIEATWFSDISGGIFITLDSLNDFMNIEFNIKEIKKLGKHAQGTMAYTTSPVHNLNTWIDLARRIEDAGSDSIAIKDMAGLLKPFDALDLVS